MTPAFDRLEARDVPSTGTGNLFVTLGEYPICTPVEAAPPPLTVDPIDGEATPDPDVLVVAPI